MWWATLPSAFIPLSWTDLKDLSYPVLSNIPTRQKHLTLSRAHTTLSCISYSSLANSCTRPSTACAVHCSSLHSDLEAGVVPACTSPVLSLVSFQVPAAQYSAGKLEGQRVVLGLQVSLCTAISLLSTQTLVTPGKKNTSMRHKALYNCSDLLLSNFRQENFFWFDIAPFLLFCSILNPHLEKKYAYPKAWKSKEFPLTSLLH